MALPEASLPMLRLRALPLFANLANRANRGATDFEQASNAPLRQTLGQRPLYLGFLLGRHRTVNRRRSERLATSLTEAARRTRTVLPEPNDLLFLLAMRTRNAN
jgi:hypothetical protein